MRLSARAVVPQDSLERYTASSRSLPAVTAAPLAGQKDARKNSAQAFDDVSKLRACGELRDGPSFAGCPGIDTRMLESLPMSSHGDASLQGSTKARWMEWIRSPAGARWCDCKRIEAEVVVDWMVAQWGLPMLQQGSGVIDVGGDPGFLAAALLRRSVPAVVVDPLWRLSGKANRHSPSELLGSSQFQALRESFDENFVARHEELIRFASAIVSIYGDEATSHCLAVAVQFGKACAVIPCSECSNLFPPWNKTYEGYVHALLSEAQNRGGQWHRADLPTAPFSKTLLFQQPAEVSSCDPYAAGHQAPVAQRLRQLPPQINSLPCQEQQHPLQQHRQQSLSLPSLFKRPDRPRAERELRRPHPNQCSASEVLDSELID